MLSCACELVVGKALAGTGLSRYRETYQTGSHAMHTKYGIFPRTCIKRDRSRLQCLLESKSMGGIKTASIRTTKDNNPNQLCISANNPNHSWLGKRLQYALCAPCSSLMPKLLHELQISPDHYAYSRMTCGAFFVFIPITFPADNFMRLVVIYAQNAERTPIQNHSSGGLACSRVVDEQCQLWIVLHRCLQVIVVIHLCHTTRSLVPILDNKVVADPESVSELFS